MINNILGQNIKQLRLANNYTQEKLAGALSVSFQLVSRWENGLAAPDIGTLCSIAQIFNTTLDALCGLAPDKAAVLAAAIDDAAKETDYQKLKASAQWAMAQLNGFPTNDAVLYALLKLLRQMHDCVSTDAQKDDANSHILKIAERLLDFSKIDSYRSFANYNLALYYSEQINPRRCSEEDKRNAQKSREYAELVLHKDMHKTFYRSFGAVTMEDTIQAMQETVLDLAGDARGACKNLLRWAKQIDSRNLDTAYIAAVQQLCEGLESFLSTAADSTAK